MRTPAALAPLALGAFALQGLAACSSASSAPQQHAPPPITVYSATVRQRPIATYESLDGQVDPYLQASIAPQQSGTLVAIYANEGDRVRKGQVLAKIDDSLLRAGLTQQQGAQTQNVAKLAQSQTQLPITDVTSKSTLTEAEGTLQEARKQQIADRANVANTKLTYEGDRTLLSQGYVSETSYEQARAAYVAAQQTLAADDDKVAQAVAAVHQAQQSLGNTQLQQQVIEQNRGAVVQGQGSIEQYQTSIEQTTLNAPFDGVVTARSLDPGAFASPSQAIYQISEIDPIYVDFNVKDTDLAYVGQGTLVSFTTSAHPNRRYTGRVASINAVPTSGTLLYRARIVEANPDLSLRGGLQVTVRVTQQSHPHALVVPRAAVAQTGSTGTVYEIENGVAHKLAVYVGLQTNDFVEISGPGVRPGMPVVNGQTDNLRDGSQVNVAK